MAGTRLVVVVATAAALTVPVGCKQQTSPEVPGDTEVAATPDPSEPNSSEGGVSMLLSYEEIIELESSPGATPPLPVQSVAPGPHHPGLEGAPGPSPAAGLPDAPVHIYLFTDFQCPACRRSVEPLKILVRNRPEVRVVFKHNALEMHPRSGPAAAAAIAADRQGRFSEYYDALYASSRLRDSDLVALAQELGLDMDRFERDRIDPAVLDQIRYETSMSQALELANTPTLFINGVKMPGWASYGAVETFVDRALKRNQALREQGVPDDELVERATRAADEDGARLGELLWGPAPEPAG